MTPQERAEKIVQIVSDNRYDDYGIDWSSAEVEVAAEISFAVAEAVADKESAIQAAVEEYAMGPHVRARLEDAYKCGQDDIRKACSAHQHNQYADGYRHGVEEEREACAKVCDGECSRRHPGFCEACKAAYIIRARTTEGGGE